MAQQVATETAKRYRLVTRSDFDGLVCAALLKQLGMLDDIKFVHPKDMQDGKVELSDRDITTNLPYVPGVHLAFDHHDSEAVRVGESRREPRDRRRTPPPPRAWCTTTSAAPSASPAIRGDDGGGRQGRRRAVLRGRDPRPERLGAPQLPDGPAHRPRPLPRLPHLELPADDAADRRLHAADGRGDPRARRTWRSASSSTATTPTPRASRSAAARPCTATSWCSTSATRRSSTPRTASSIYALFPQCNISIHVLWGLSSRTRCSRPASRSSTARAAPTSAS